MTPTSTERTAADPAQSDAAGGVVGRDRTPTVPLRTADAGGPPGMPGWVKVSGVMVLVLVLLLVIAMVVGGDHGPGRHMPSGAPAGGGAHPSMALGV